MTGTRGQVVVGLMSGTSLDGITAAVACFTEAEGRTAVELLAQVQRPYDAPTRERLASALVGATPREYTRLDFALGGWLADAAIAAIAEAGIARDDISAIASHGHTVWHEPPDGTWQFGQPAVIAERTGIPVIADFRVRDLAAGGQGAPLVPLADAALFSAESHWRVLQNLGGIGNLTVVPPRGVLEGVRAFDTGPGVVVLDGVTRVLRPELPYDVDGTLAKAGRPIESVLEALLADPWFEVPPPKSTGRERYTMDFIATFIERCRTARGEVRDEDIVATAAWFTARSIERAFARFIPEPVEEVLLSGGGVRHPVLREAIAMVLSPRHVRPFDAVFFDGEAKEAVAFAYLGWCHLMRRAGNVPKATGARGARVLGAWYPA